MNTYRIGFIIEQALGHITHAKNLQTNVPKDTAVTAHWALPGWDTSGPASKLPLYNSNWTVRAGWQARRAVAAMKRRTALDVLFFHTQVTAVLARDWMRRIPSVVSLDATPWQYDAMGAFYAHNAGPGWLERWKWRMNRDCFRAARRLVTWSEWARQGLIDDYEVPPEKVVVIPPGVNVRDWRRPTPRQGHDKPIKILFVGGNLERKGGLLLIEAFHQLHSRRNGTAEPIELHLVTKDKVALEPGLFLYQEIKPNSPTLKQLYHDCDIFCLPTLGDALPMVLSEAGAAGLPAVSTQLAAIPEVVRDEETGFLVPLNDTPALTAALQRLIEDPELRLRQGERAATLARQEFDAEQNTFRLLDLLKQTADEARNGRQSRANGEVT